MKPGEERADAQCAGLRVRCLDSGGKVFFYRYRARGGDKPAQDPMIEGSCIVHDLRRTVATALAKLGCSRVVQDRILNHVDRSVSAIYDQHRYDDEARAWVQKWADHLQALTARNLVPLRAA